MTEEEAKTKWCPMTRAGNAAGCNRSDATTNCIGSDCMMWTKINESELIAYKTTTNGVVIDHVYSDENEGHCGLVKRE
jgi:hypothetical protein